MKTVLVAACALVLGIFLGGLGPRTELRRAKKELADARQAASRASSAPQVLPLALGALAAAGERGGGLPPPRFVEPPQGSARKPAETAPDREEHRLEAERRRPGWLGLQDPVAFEAAKIAADLRALQFRATFFEQARLPPEGQAAVEEAVRTMNQELAQAARKMTETVRLRRDRLGTRDAADMAAEVIDVYRRADDRFKKGLDQTALDALDRTRFDLTTQVDLGSFRALVTEAFAAKSPGQAAP